MNCRDFEHLLNEQLDARDAASASLAHALRTHISDCSDCRELARRYDVLKQALGFWGTPAALPEDLATRVIGALEAEMGRRSSPVLSFSFPKVFTPARVAAAAAVLLVSLVGLRVIWGPRPPAVDGSKTGGVAVRPVEPSPARPLPQAFAAATSATWDLARETSAPAARVGRDMLASASVSNPTPVLPVSIEPPSEMLRAVGDGVDRGVRPLSGSARSAFGFLLPTTVRAKAPADDRGRDA